jgi:hypothetical protein
VAALLLVTGLVDLAVGAAGGGVGGIVFEATRQARTAEVGAASVEYAFKFKNTSGEHVAVAGIEQGCGCLKGEAAFESVAPGAAGEIHASVATANLYGTVVKSLWVSFSNGERHELVTELKIPATLVVEPNTLEWQRGAAAGERKVDIRVESGPAILLEEVSCNIEQMEVRHEVVEAGRHYILYLRPKSTAEEFSAVVQVRTSSRDSRDAIRAVFAAVTGGKVAGGLE